MPALIDHPIPSLSSFRVTPWSLFLITPKSSLLVTTDASACDRIRNRQHHGYAWPSPPVAVDAEVQVSGNSVLIISNHPLFAEAITHVLASEGIAVVAVASNLPAAVPLLHEYRPSTIIVDCEEPCRPQAEMLALLEDAERGSTRRCFSHWRIIAWSSTSGASSATPARPTWSPCCATVRVRRPALE